VVAAPRRLSVHSRACAGLGKRRWQWGADVIQQAVASDSRLSRAIGNGDLTPVGAGGGSLVYLTPKAGRVVRLTREMSMPECDVIEALVGRKRAGWPRVYDVVRLEAEYEDEDYCIAVVEEVTPASAMRWGSAKRRDVTDAAFLVKRYFPDPLKYSHENDRVKKWARQLYEGLRTIGRQDVRYELDLYNPGNWGLDSEERAVWVDFGV